MVTTTFLFADQVASTEQIRALGDEVAGRLRAALLAGLVEAVVEHDGRVVDLTGDGLFAAFSSSIDALAAAIDMQAAVSLTNDARPVAQQVGLRIGVHTGEPRCDERGGYFGLPVVVARRLCDLAPASGIFASPIVHALADPRRLFTFAPAGRHVLKGVEEPVAVWRVAWSVPPASVALPPPLRLPEPARRATLVAGVQLRRLWDDVAAGGRRAALVQANDDGARQLVAAIGRQAHDAGAVVLALGAEESPGLAAAFAPLFRARSAAAVRMALGEYTDRLAGQWPVVGERLGALDPAASVGSDNPAAPAAPAPMAGGLDRGLDGAGADPVPADIVVQMVEPLIGGRPLVLVVDGFDTLDAHDLALLDALVDPDRSGSVLVLLTAPASTGATGPRLAPLLHRGLLVVNVADTHAPTGQSRTIGADAATTMQATGRPALATVILTGGGQVAVDPAGTLVGRGPECGVRLDDPDVSRRHALIRAVGAQWVLADQHSMNGTQVNDQPVVETVLSDGDRIHVGATELGFRAG